jgi:hypothetical protein
MDDFDNGRNVTALPPGMSSFNWQTKLKDLLPGEFQFMDPWANEKANLRDVLSHASGMPL